MKHRTTINDSWVLSRAGYFSRSFSNFLSNFAVKLPEKEREEVEKELARVPEELEKATRMLESLKVNEPNVPRWIKPFVSKITDQALKRVSSGLANLADTLFGAGIFSLSDVLYEVAKERGITNEAVLHLIKMLPEFEALMYFLNVRKYYRDHCAHQLRVAVMGDFLLDKTTEAGGMEGLIKDRLDFSREEVRTAWWFAGLLHDTGIPLAKLCTAVNWSLLNEILRCYSSMDIKASPMSLDLASGNLENREYLSILMEGVPKRWREKIETGLGVSDTANEMMLFRAGYYKNQEYNPRTLQIDHGVVSAVNLLRTLGPPEKLRKNLPEDRPLIEAARAISVHNFKDDLKNVPFEDFPLAFLLILVDELQEWSRPVPVRVEETYFTTNLEKIALLDAIFYEMSDELWDVPFKNIQAKKLAKFDFKRLCQDKANVLKVLDCTDQFPESEVQLRDIKVEKPRKEDKFRIEVGTK